jgi:hypothetical protein
VWERCVINLDTSLPNDWDDKRIKGWEKSTIKWYVVGTWRVQDVM